MAHEDDFLSTAPRNDIDDDDDAVIFLGQQTSSFLSSAQAQAEAPRRSSRRPKEKCTRCKRSGDACDLNSPCGSCINAGASEQCYHLSDHDKSVLRLLQQQYGAPCVACGVRDFCDRESPCSCCEHLGLECEYHPGVGKKAKSLGLPGSYVSLYSRNFIIDPRFVVNPRAMGFTDMPSPVSPLQLGSTKRKRGATLPRERPNLEHESGLDGKDTLVNSTKRKRGAVISSKHHNLEHESGDNSGTFIDETDSSTTNRRSTDSADSADSTSPITIGCPANRYSKVANCPKRLPPPTTRANVRIIREHVHGSHPCFTMNVGHFTCKRLGKINPLGYLSKEIFCFDHEWIALILPPHPHTAHVNDGTWFPGKY
jgi:hypothetical protein